MSNKKHPGRQPVIGHRLATFKAEPKAKAANAAFNAKARRAGSAARKLTVQQGAALLQSGSRTY